MKLVSNKSAHIDINDVPLSTLIEKNSDPVDVSFVSRNNFNKNAYRGNFNPRHFPRNSPNKLWKLLWMKLLNCLIILWQIIHNGIPKGHLLVKN